MNGPKRHAQPCAGSNRHRQCYQTAKPVEAPRRARQFDHKLRVVVKPSDRRYVWRFRYQIEIVVRFNLVSRCPLVSRRHSVLALSPEAGVWEEVGQTALRVHPFDVAGTADVMHRALSVPEDQRRALHARRLAIVRGRPPRDWLADLVAAAG